MPKAALTRSVVRSSTCPLGLRKIDIFDVGFPGFMLEVRSSGGKTYYQRYRDRRGRNKQFKIGSAEVLTLSRARRKARSILAEALLGNDPQKEREELRQVPTLAEFARNAYLPHAKNVKRSWRTDETVLRLHILPKLGRLPLDLISNQAIAELARQMHQAGYATGTSNRVVILTRFIFNLANKWGVAGSANNPAKGLKIAADVCRERFLTDEETSRLIGAIDQDENRVAANAIKLLLLTGARRNEVTQAKWEYVNWNQRTLLVPCSKSGRPRLIRLNTAALDLLRQVPRMQNDIFIFPSPMTGRPSKSLHFPWTRIRRRANLLDVRLHDLRHSYASFLVNEGVSLYIVQGLLGHANSKATQRYAHLSNDTLSNAAEVVGRVLAASANNVYRASDSRYDAGQRSSLPKLGC